MSIEQATLRNTRRQTTAAISIALRSIGPLALVAELVLAAVALSVQESSVLLLLTVMAGTLIGLFLVWAGLFLAYEYMLSSTASQIIRTHDRTASTTRIGATLLEVARGGVTLSEADVSRITGLKDAIASRDKTFLAVVRGQGVGWTYRWHSNRLTLSES